MTGASTPRSEQLLARGTPELGTLLSLVAAVGRERREAVWAVGGVVRDLLLGASSKDVDLVLIGDVAEFAQALAARVGGDPRSHSRFLTTDFTTSGGFDIDIVRARSEHYVRAAALPSVRPGTLSEDLYRRDFTVNTMALPLAGARGGVLDPFGGQTDLEARRLRVLHDDSFTDDPTRILRGLRLASRLELQFESHTAMLAADAVARGAFDALTGERFRGEIVPLLDDPAATRRSLQVFADLGLDKVLSPALALGTAADKRLERVEARWSRGEVEEPVWLTTLMAMVWNLSTDDLKALRTRLVLDGEPGRLLVALPGQVDDAGRNLETLNSPYERYKIGSSLGLFGRSVAICCGDEALAAFLLRDWPTLDSCRLGISGADLIRLGFSPSAGIGASLEETLRARLDRRIGESDELEFAAGWLRERE